MASYLARAGRILTWRHWAWATALPVLIAASMPLQNFSTNRYWALWQLLFNIPWYLLIAYLFLAAIVLAEASVTDPASPSAWRYIAAIVVASLACVALAGALHDYFPKAPKLVVSGQTLERTVANGAEQPLSRRAQRMIGTFNPLLSAWLATFVYVGLRKSRRARRALADAEVGRSEAQRVLAAAQLVAAHAQIDPAFVLQRITDIEQAYDCDPARADAELDDLIDFLRAAIPRLRAEAVGVAS